MPADAPAHRQRLGKLSHWPWSNNAVALRCCPPGTSEAYWVEPGRGRWGTIPRRKRPQKLPPEGTQNRTKNATIFPHDFFRLISLLKESWGKIVAFFVRFRPRFCVRFWGLQWCPVLQLPRPLGRSRGCRRQAAQATVRPSG